jgi:hypothetical protein
VPDEPAAYRERPRLVVQCIKKLEMARLKVVYDVREKESAPGLGRMGRTHDAVA